jgi:hypothetical protein
LKKPAERVPAEAEVSLGLPADRDDRVVLAGEDVGFDLALGGALHTGVVAAAQTAVGSDDDVAGVLDLVATGQQRRVGRRSARGKVRRRR